jgi:selenocysteine lyase/cysteine desulfurase
MGSLSLPAGKKVGYARDGSAFLGATQDYSGVYRFNSVWKLFQGQKLDVFSIHQRIRALQTKFIEKLPVTFLSRHNLKPLYPTELSWHGHFLTFEAPHADSALKLQAKLSQANIIVDCRGSRVRFGFGLYHDLADVTELCRRLEEVAENL